MNPFKNNFQKRNNYRDNAPDNRFFKKQDNPSKYSLKIDPPKPEYINSETDFPTLTIKQENVITESTTTNVPVSFSKMMKDSLNNNTIESFEEILEPGWISMKLNKETRSIEIKSGPKTQYTKRMDHLNNLEDNLNYRMYNAIETILQRSLKYEAEYDKMHGEGEFGRLYRFQDIYDSETDEEDNDVEYLEYMDDYSEDDPYY